MSKPEVDQERSATDVVIVEERGIDLFGVVVALLTEWRTGMVVFLVVTLACVAYVLSLKPQYVATAVLLPQAGSSGSGTISALFSNRGPGTLYIGLLQSRSVQDSVIQIGGLQHLFHTTTAEQTRDALAGKSSF